MSTDGVCHCKHAIALQNIVYAVMLCYVNFDFTLFRDIKRESILVLFVTALVNILLDNSLQSDHVMAI